MINADKETSTILPLPGTPPSADVVLQAVTSSLDHDKAVDVVVISLAGKSNMADYMVVASGTSKRHIGAMADHILEAAKALHTPFLASEGESVGDWVLIDTGDVVVHLFRPEIRAFYALERLWGAPAVVDTAAIRQSRLGV